MISAVVLAKNEEKNIGDCLKSLQWCDELVVIDDGSEDKTVEIAKKHRAKVYRHRLNDDFAAQRNFGLKKAKGEWVFFVDADERVSHDLKEEILESLQYINVLKCVGFWVKRRDWFGGRGLGFGETSKVRLLRLARKDAGEWKRRVHETWEVEGKVGELSNSLYHYPHQTISEFLTEVNFYSTLHAQALRENNANTSLFQILAYPLGKFLQNYFWRLGFLDGMPGLMIALMMSLHSFLARAKLYTRKTRQKRVGAKRRTRKDTK